MNISQTDAAKERIRQIVINLVSGGDSTYAHLDVLEALPDEASTRERVRIIKEAEVGFIVFSQDGDLRHDPINICKCVHPDQLRETAISAVDEVCGNSGSQNRGMAETIKGTIMSAPQSLLEQKLECDLPDGRRMNIFHMSCAEVLRAFNAYPNMRQGGQLNIANLRPSFC